MVKYRIKIVPKDAPNADGEWRDVEIELQPDMCWLDAAMVFDSHVPGTHFLCAFERVRP